MPSDAPVLPGYTLQRPLGRGAGSVVYAATDAAGQPVAVKLLRPDAADDPLARTLIRRELRAGLKVRHAHLLRVFGGHGFAPPFYVVMERLTGESLADRLARRGPLPAAEAVAVGRQLAAALAALHRAGLVHADVKPDNVWLTAPGRAKLIDLGFCHLPGENADLHAAGQVLGTANYLAPELCRQPPDDGPPADVFALGVTLFESLTGKLPFYSGDVAEVVRRRPTESPADLRKWGDFPPAVSEAVSWPLARDPADRPTAAELVGRLTRLQLSLQRQRVG